MPRVNITNGIKDIEKQKKALQKSLAKLTRELREERTRLVLKELHGQKSKTFQLVELEIALTRARRAGSAMSYVVDTLLEQMEEYLFD